MASQDNGEGSSTGARPSNQQPQQGLGLDVDLNFDMDFSGLVSEGEEGEGGGEGGGGARQETEEDGEVEVEDGMTPEERERNKRNLAAAQHARDSITDSALTARGIDPNNISSEMLDEQTIPSSQKTGKSKIVFVNNGQHFFTRMGNYPELYMELALHLRIKDLISLYSISKDFHEIINGRLAHCMRACADYQAKESYKAFPFKFYASLCVRDPTGAGNRTRPNEVRLVPGLRWLQMVVHREKAVRDILACMARQGHRMPATMSLSIKKMWLVMDVSTTAARVQLMHSKLFSDVDIFNIQMFIVKLDMRFNDPIDGPGTETLRKLFLGQRGLTPLRKLLKREAYLTYPEIVKTAVRYAHTQRNEHSHMPIFGIPPEEVGIGHLEGWGAGRVHLARPDELVMTESVRRSLGLKNHIMEMMLWGYIDPISGLNIVVSEEEMYMSDDEGKKDSNWSNYREQEPEAEVEDDEDDEADR